MDLPLRMSRECWSPRKRDTGCVTSRGQGPDFKGILRCSGNAPLCMEMVPDPETQATSRCGLGLDTGVVSRRMWMRSSGVDVEVRGDRLGVRARFRPQHPKLTPESILVASHSWTLELLRSIATGPTRQCHSRDTMGIQPLRTKVSIL